MKGETIKIQSNEGVTFDCYLAMPAADRSSPAVVLASAIHGVDRDICNIAEEFAAQGYIAAAPDLFWRSIPGPLPRGDDRASERSQPRLERIRVGEWDLLDTLAHLKTLHRFNGAAALMGFCYGGPYAIIAPKRLGYAAGISCHGTRMLDYIEDFEGLSRPISILWGDQDHRAPVEVRDAYRTVSRQRKNVDVHIFPGVLHAYMMRANAKAFDQRAYDFSMARAVAMLEGLCSD